MRLLQLDWIGQDVRSALRNLRRYPIAAAVAIVSLAGGIGATTVTLTIRHVVFRKAPPLYAEPHALSRIQVGTPDRPIMPIGSNVPAPLFRTWSDTIGGMAAARPLRGVRDVRAGDRTESVPVREVTPDLFEVLGVAPALGDTLSTAHQVSGQPAVLSHRLWQQLFDGRQDAIGAAIWIENRPFTVIGVMPERFWFSEMNSPVWTRVDPRTLAPDDTLEVVARRPGGTTPSMLEARLTVGLAEYARALPVAQRQLRLKISGIEGTPIGNQVSIALPYVLGTSVLLTLLIACANVAILMIAQWTAREQEIAIRASIGASRARIVRGLLAESVLLAAAGGAVGILATLGLRAWILQRGAVDARFFDLSIDIGILLQSAALTLAAGLIAGIAPALYETRRLHANPLRSMAGSDRVRQRWRHALVVLEITVTVALLVVATAMIDGYRQTRLDEMGFDPHPLLVTFVENPNGVPIGAMIDALKGEPGVAAVAAATVMPYAGTPRPVRVATDASDSNATPAERTVVTAGFFSTLGVPLRAGRAFTPQDSPATRTAIVNEALARRLFKGQPAVGARIWAAGAAFEIVGVVGDYANNPMQVRSPEPRLFLPLETSRSLQSLAVLVRASGDPAALVQPIRRAAQQSAAGTTAPRAYTFDQVAAIMGQEMLVGTAPLVPLISIGTLLTAAGIYGVLAFAITRRSRELAVRVAIGATSSDIVGLVAAQSARIVGVGAGAGLAATFVLTRIVRASGGAGSIFDPPAHVFIPPAVIVLLIAAAATWVPSRRAARIDPSVLLRSL